MSHFSTIKTKLTNKDVLIKALNALNYSTQESVLLVNPQDHDHQQWHVEVAVNDLEPSDVVVDTGTGSDHIYIENDWSGTLLLVNNESTDKLFVDQETSYSTVTEDGDWIISLTDGSEITIEGYLTFNEVSGYHEVTGPSMANTGYAPYDLGFGDMGFTSLVGSNYTNDLLFSASVGLDVIDNDTVYLLNGWDGDDVLYGGSGTQHLLGQLGNDTFYIDAVSQSTLITGDIREGDTIYKEGELPALQSVNTSFSDVVYIGWSYEDSVISQEDDAYLIENIELDAQIKIYGVEELNFDNGDGTWDQRLLTDGAPIDIDANYGDGSKIKFVLTDDPASVEGDDVSSDWLQVYVADKKSDKLLWEGDRNSVNGFNFADGTYVNVINIADADVFNNPITYTLGTTDIDIIFGNDSDNLIDGMGGHDIIFGGGGSDVIIGGDGDDVIIGGDGDDLIHGDGVDQDHDAAAQFEAAGVSYDKLSASDLVGGGDDTIMGGDGLDDIYSGDGNNFVTGGRLEDSDGNTDLEILQEHMTAHNDIFEDDDWI